jgi:predicted PurR-regulated permease PerM
MAEYKLRQSVYTLLFLLLSFGGLYFAKEFLVPVTLAAIFSMLFIRLCNWFETKHIGRGFASFLCIALFFIAIATVILLLSWQLSSLSENVDGMKDRLLDMFNKLRNWVNETVGISWRQQEEMIKEQSKNGGASAGAMALSFAGGAFSVLVNAVLVTVYMYLFLYYRSHIKKFILKLVQRHQKPLADEVVHKSGKVAQKYLSGMGAMIFVLWIMYGIGFSAIGVENAIFFAILCGLLEIVPFVGNLTGTSVTILSVLAQGGDSKTVILVVVIYAFVQFIQTYILEPLIVGEQVNINPLFTIMSLVLGEMIWGIPGMILAIPLLGITKIICDHVPDLEPYGFLIGPDKPREKRKGLFSFGKK